MQCTVDRSAQILTDKKGNAITREISIFLRYPHSQTDKINGHAHDACSQDAKKFIDEYNETHEQEIKFHDVNVINVIGDSDTDCSWDGTCHWQYKGVAKYEIYVICSD